MCEVLDRIENRGIEKGILQGISQGILQGEEAAFSLVRRLIRDNRLEDLKRATEDEAYRNRLLEEFEKKTV